MSPDSQAPFGPYVYPQGDVKAGRRSLPMAATDQPLQQQQMMGASAQDLNASYRLELEDQYPWVDGDLPPGYTATPTRG
ncbi:hypothetical protein CYLTODRAFT_419792 [Cylindrobasidium torrendii FP15055 ss-10]|uniref:Uncharacterized protein n=1 Tax=Cylindrobasidium torrendii FP15055 ss-10 TaxID=1314674 RepID=A0A0D7BJM0_9AGAR|nr:hypothetical protein CYLTODRAFT_419792 [Cylindrobasidium torrendii FP15055 ss-10]